MVKKIGLSLNSMKTIQEESVNSMATAVSERWRISHQRGKYLDMKPGARKCK